MQKILTGKEEMDARQYLEQTKEIATNSACFRSKCGSLITKDGKIIGEGYNSPPLDKTLKVCRKDGLPLNFKSDKTCCVHAEQRAIMNALRKHPSEINGSRLYFVRLNDKDEIIFAGHPYCTICSKMALDAGVKEFVLWHEDGITVYDTESYNELSFAHKNPKDDYKQLSSDIVKQIKKDLLENKEFKDCENKEEIFERLERIIFEQIVVRLGK